MKPVPSLKAEAPRVYSVSQWQKDFARAFAAAVPLEAMPTKARGALLASANDEPEPDAVEGDAS